jgi:inward rectifier potassium channel
LVNASWPKFIIIVLAGYIVLNTIFAALYYFIGIQHLQGVLADSEGEKFLEAFFFSAQSFTTVGYGRISPFGFWTSSIAAFESLIGLLCLALATGLLYGKFSRPISKILYSKNALIAPFKEVTGFMFRMVNKQRNQMQDVEVRVMFSRLEINGGVPSRKFFNLKLEYNKINFFPSAWTVNHIINEESPLFGMTEQDFQNDRAEFLILLQGFDDTFSQTVLSRFSYRYDEVVWGAKFVNIYGLDASGRTTVALDRLNDFERM